MKSRLIVIALSAFFVLALPIRASVVAGTSDLKPMIKLNLSDLGGNKVDSNSLKGSVLVLDFWATWCGPCIREIPSLNELQEHYGSRGVKVIGVTLASGDAKTVKPRVASNKMNYTVLMGDDSQGFDLNIMGYPTTYLITRDWKIYRTYVGAGPRKIETIRADIEKLLSGETN